MTLESFLEPSKRVDIVPVSRDTVKKIHIKEGQNVKTGQILFTLDHDVLIARRNTAKILASVHSQIDSASVVVEMRRKQLESLQQLKQTGHVRPKELEKSKAELAIAEADLVSAREEILIRKAELKQIDTQIALKKIVSPIDGIVVRIYKEEGEIIGINDADILVTVVKTIPLRATFHVPESIGLQLTAGDKVSLQVTGVEQTVVGRILFSSPLVNPESSTVRVTVGLPKSFRAKSGIRCTMETDQIKPQ